MSDDDRFDPEDSADDALWDEGEHLGPRRAALEKRRRSERRKRALLGTIMVIAGVAAAAAIVVYAAKEVVGNDEAVPIDQGGVSTSVTTTLVFGTRTAADGTEKTVWTSLLVYDSEEIRGAVAYVPAHTAVEVPGRGLLALGDAYDSGGIPLLLVTAENLFGVTIDRYLQLSENDARVLMRNIGDLSVDVPHEVRVSLGGGDTRVIFSSGQQLLPPPFLARLLYVVGEDADDVALGSRHLAFWDALFDAYEGDPQALVDAVVASGGSLGKSDAPVESLSDLFGDLAALPGASRSLRALPVSPLEVPGSRLYLADEGELEAFVSEVVGDSAALADQIRVQILNGNGAPGIGQEVAERLVGEGFRVILSGNAKRLDYETTLIISYSNTPEATALAEKARALLGVGELRVSRQEQGIVDLTIVVGKDFLRTR